MKPNIPILSFFILTVLCSTVVNPSYAQISGYQGKKVSFGYGANIGYAMFSRNSEGSSLFGKNTGLEVPQRLLSLNYKHQFQLEVVTSNNTVFGIHGSYGLTQFKALSSSDEYVSNIMHYDNYTGNTYYYTEYLNNNVYGKMKIITAGLSIKKFTTNTAPIGKYVGYKLSVLRYAADLSGINVPADFNLNVLPKKDDYHHSIVFAISKGTARIYYNRFLVDSNVEFGIPFVMPSFKLFDLDNYNTEVTTAFGDQITKRMNNRLWGNFLINVNVNVSLLAF